MGIFNRKDDTELIHKNLKCKVCGKEIFFKVNNKYQVCRDCILNAKILCKKKPEFETKQRIIILTIIGVFLLLVLINILAALTNHMIPALLLTGTMILLGLVFLRFALDG